MEKNKKFQPLRRIKNGVEEVKKELKAKTITLILGGFGLVAALAWNEAIKTLFETLFPKKSELVGKFIYAAIVTIIVVLVSLQLGKIPKSSEKE
jgi:formate/nitrite transporter FocA (FNT family)